VRSRPRTVRIFDERTAEVMGNAAMTWFWIWPTLVAAGLVLLGYVAYRIAGSRESARGGSTRRILDQRLARGEISVDDYRRRFDLL
jgi:uncharacterized membrane protein